MIDSILRNPTAFVWLKEMKRRDHYGYQHAMGCAIWAASVGKTRVAEDLLNKRTPLTAAEVDLVRQHVQHGLEIIDATPGLSPKIREIVATHHERHDGSGYPWHLRGSDIPIFGRIMGVIDSYDAMTCVRPYASSALDEFARWFQQDVPVEPLRTAV